MRAVLSPRRWLWATLGLIVVVWLTLWQFHETSQTDPLDNALVGLMGGTALLLVLFMLATRRDWPPEALGLFALLLGDVLLWGGAGFAGRMGWLPQPAPWWFLSLVRAPFVIASLILLFYMALWLWWRWGLRWPRRRWLMVSTAALVLGFVVGWFLL